MTASSPLSTPLSLSPSSSLVSRVSLVSLVQLLQHSQSTTAVTNNVSLTVTGRDQDPSGEADQTTLTRILATVQATELPLQQLEHKVSEIHEKTKKLKPDLIQPQQQ